MRWTLLLLVGCWTAPRPVGPPALLRRNHAVGDVLRVCERGDGVTFVAGVDPVMTSIRQIHDEHVLAVEPRRIELRTDTHGVAVRLTTPGHEPGNIDVGAVTGTPFTIDERNRGFGKEAEKPVSSSESHEFHVATTPYVNDIVGVEYPERAIRQNESFDLRVRRTVMKEGTVPSRLAIDATFVVMKVEPDHVELSCRGTQTEEARHGKHSARVELALTCRARIARRDGRTARWWIDTNGTFTQSGQRYPLRAKMHYDVAVGDTDESVCARAAER